MREEETTRWTVEMKRIVSDAAPIIVGLGDA